MVVNLFAPKAPLCLGNIPGPSKENYYYYYFILRLFTSNLTHIKSVVVGCNKTAWILRTVSCSLNSVGGGIQLEDEIKVRL